jgi:hypothetical protein
VGSKTLPSKPEPTALRVRVADCAANGTVCHKLPQFVVKLID